jgi:hypothetical protein
MKAHRPWQPHLDREPLFNPFVPTTVRPLVEEGVELAPAEDEQAKEQSPEEGEPPVEPPTEV